MNDEITIRFKQSLSHIQERLLHRFIHAKFRVDHSIQVAK